MIGLQKNGGKPALKRGEPETKRLIIISIVTTSRILYRGLSPEFSKKIKIGIMIGLELTCIRYRVPFSF